MSASRITLAVAALGLVAGAAHAQNKLVELDDKVQVAAFSATVDEIDDMDVVDAAGTKIGEVEEVVGENANTASALVVDFDGTGGFTDQDVVVPLDQFSLENNRLVLKADAATVGGMEVWKD